MAQAKELSRKEMTRKDIELVITKHDDAAISDYAAISLIKPLIEKYLKEESEE